MSDDADAYDNERLAVEKIHESRGRIERELAKVIVGQKEATHQLLDQLVCRRPLPDHRRTRAGQDLARSHDRAGFPPEVSADSVHARPDAG